MITSNYNFPKLELKNKTFDDVVEKICSIAPEEKKENIINALQPLNQIQHIQYGYEIEYDDDVYVSDYIHKDLLDWSRNNNRKYAEIFKYNEKPIIDKYTFKVYAYDHSGVSFSLSPFGCEFDSGLAGYVRYTKDDLSPEEARKFIAGVIDSINSIYNDKVYRYCIYCIKSTIINKKEISIDKELVDCCGSFIGNLNYCEEDAKSQIEYYYEQEAE